MGNTEIIEQAYLYHVLHLNYWLIKAIITGVMFGVVLLTGINIVEDRK